MSANEDYDREAGLANLTDEERAALAEDDLSPEEKAALQEIAGEDGEDGDGGEDEDEDGDDDAGDGEGDGDDTSAATDAGTADAAPDGATAAAAPKGAAAADTEDHGDEEGDDDERVRHVYHAELPEDFDDRVKALGDAEAELAAKFKAGDVEADEFMQESRRLVRERNQLDGLRMKAEMATEMNQQAAAAAWEESVGRFMRRVKKDEGIDYVADEAKCNDLDVFVKALSAKPENADKSFSWFLEQAHKATKALHGVGDKPAGGKGATPAAKADGKPDAKQVRKPPVDKIPKTVAHVPGGDGPGDVGDEFAELDSLDGDEYERALAKLSPAQRERYLAAA
jgi:hypothetical protein